MRIGIDFDNTIVCYDDLIYQTACQRGLVPPDIEPAKRAIRDHLRAENNEEAWIEIQGYIYGQGINGAQPFEGVREFLSAATKRGAELWIVSHKTRQPVRGPECDLHDAARGWLENQGLFDPERYGISPGRAFFELTKQAKIDRIAALGCTHFIDDLIEFLTEPTFPSHVQRILFDPHRSTPTATDIPAARSWWEIADFLRE